MTAVTPVISLLVSSRIWLYRKLHHVPGNVIAGKQSNLGHYSFACTDDGAATPNNGSIK